MDIAAGRSPLLPVLAAYMAGLLAAVFLPVGIWWIVGVETALAFAAMLFSWRGWAVRMISCALGSLMVSASLPPTVDVEALNRENPFYSGRVENVVYNPASQKFTVSVDSVDGGKCHRFRIEVYMGAVLPLVSDGDRIRFRAMLDYPCSRNVLSGNSQRTRLFYLRKGISALAPVAESENLTVTGYQPGFDTWLDSRRDRFAAAIYGSGLEEPCAEFLISVFTGDRRFLDPVLQENFRGAGLAHVLALSGTHIAVIAFMVSLILFPLRLLGRRRWQWVLTVVALWAYAVFVGMTASVVRAVIMATFLMVGRLTERRTDPFNNLCAAALLILLVRPFDLFSAGFQLTFLAVAAILMFAWIPSGIRNTPLRVASQWVVVSVAAVVGTAPVAAFYFHNFPALFLVANLPVAVVLPLLMTTGLLTVALSSVGVPCGWLGRVTDTVFSGASGLAEWIAGIDGADIEGIYFSAWILVPYYIGMTVLWLGIRRRRILLSFDGLLLMAAAMIFVQPGRLTQPSKETEVYPLGSRFSTAILVTEGEEAWLYTDAEKSGLRSLTYHISSTSDEFMQLKGIKSVKLGKPGVSGRAHRSAPGEWIIKDKRFVILPGYADSAGVKKVDYLLLKRGYKSDVRKDIGRFNPDTVIVSPTLAPLRARAVADSVRAIGKPLKYIF